MLIKYHLNGIYRQRSAFIRSGRTSVLYKGPLRCTKAVARLLGACRRIKSESVSLNRDSVTRFVVKGHRQRLVMRRSSLAACVRHYALPFPRSLPFLTRSSLKIRFVRLMEIHTSTLRKCPERKLGVTVNREANFREVTQKEWRVAFPTSHFCSPTESVSRCISQPADQHCAHLRTLRLEER
jgi:hypothetical protein